MKRLDSLIRRVLDCRRGEHRETVEGSFGVLRLRCLDCGRTEAKGWIYVGVSNRKAKPWEETA